MSIPSKLYFYLLLCIFCLINCNEVNAFKPTEDSNIFKPVRFYPLVGGSIVLYGATLYGLNDLWYKDYPRSSFHFFNDNKEWLQMDKIGHAYSAYYESIIGIEGLRWTGVKDKKAILAGGLVGFICQTPIEVLDGFSSNWGFSVGDFAANVFGCVLATSQELIFNEQKIMFKFSFYPTEYASERPDILGNSFVQNLLKDYNGQTYWLSTSMNNFTGKRHFFPDWLYFSVGYGANGMMGGEENPPEFIDIKRYRQYYLSLDINTLKLKGKNKMLNAFLTAFSVIKFPAPALEFNNDVKNNFKFHFFYF